MKKRFFGVVAFTFSIFLVNAQTVTNGGFEDGPQSNNYNQLYKATGWETGCSYNYNISNYGTPDLYDCTNSSTYAMDTPADNILNPRPTAGNCRFAGMLGPVYSSTYGLNRQESIKTTTGQWTDDFLYTVSFYVARHNIFVDYTPSVIHMEAVLRKSGDCTQSKVIDFPTDVTIQNYVNTVSSNWTYLEASFVLTSSESAIGFDQLEIRPKYEGENIPDKVFVDDVGLVKAERPLADVVASNYDDISVQGSIYGPQSVFEFCEDDPIVMNGELSSGESNYLYSIKEFDLATWTAGTTLYSSGWIAGTAPSAIDITSAGPYVPGQTYMMTLAVGPYWHSDVLFFTVKECCPEGLDLITDCENGTISITNIPSGATNVDISWSYVYLDGNSWQTIGMKPTTTTVSASLGYGTYVATVTYTLPDGTECILSGSSVYSKDECCDILGPHINDYSFGSNRTVLVETDPWGQQEIPIINCDAQLTIDTECEDFYYLSIQPFDPVSWTTISGPYYSVFPNATFPDPVSITSLLSMTNGSYYLITMGVDADGVAPLDDVEYQVVYYYCDSKRIGADMGGSEDVWVIEPNPSDNKTTVKFKDVESGILKVLSMQGEVLQVVDFIKEDNVNLDVSKLSTGVYFIEVTIEGNSISRKFIKN